MKYIVEYLPHLQIFTVFISYDKKLSFSKIEEYKLIIQRDDNIQQSILLPRCVNIDPNSIYICKNNSQWVIRAKAVTDPKVQNYVHKHDNFTTRSASKWNRTSLLNTKFKFECSTCHNTLIEHSDCLKLGDMPSEYWYELMDYWHCHKPHLGDDNIYSARYNYLVPSTGELLIGDSFISVNESWLSGKLDVQGNTVACVVCSSVLGEYTSGKVFKLFKWNLMLTIGKDKDTYPIENAVVAQILTYINSNATRMFLLKNKNENKCLIWIFSIDLDITISENIIKHNTLKVYYSYNEDFIDSQFSIGTLNIETLNLDNKMFDAFVKSMNYVNELLPDSLPLPTNWKLSYISYM